MASVTWLDRRQRDGLAISPARNVPAGAIKRVVAELDAPAFGDPALGVSIVIEQSFDGGLSWHHVAGVTGVGGQIDEAGDPVVPSVGTSFDDGLLRQVRVRVEAMGRFSFGVVGEVG